MDPLIEDSVGIPVTAVAPRVVELITATVKNRFDRREQYPNVRSYKTFEHIV